MVNSGAIRIYLDESGNAGEVFFKEENKRFGNQPFFALGGIGLNHDNEADTKSYVDYLKNKYRVESVELKSKGLYERKPKFVLELTQWLYHQKIPLFMELMDKKFYLVAQLLENVLFAKDMDFDDASIVYRHFASDFLFTYLPDQLYYLFSEACRTGAKDQFETFLFGMKDFLEESCEQIETAGIGLFLLAELQTTIQAYKQSCSESDHCSTAHFRFLPEPDLNARGNTVRLLPHVPALANICARVEQYRRTQGVERVQFVHDEQHHFSGILNDNINLLLEIAKILPSPSGDFRSRVSYDFTDPINLNFRKSHDWVGIQIADVLTGTVMRAWNHYQSEKILPDTYRELFYVLFSYNNLHRSCGVNFVVESSRVTEFEHFLNPEQA